MYDPVKSVDDVFNKIVKHQDLSILMSNPLTDRQLVGIAYKIFNRAHVFQSALLKWNKKRTAEKTFHMRQQWSELNKVGALKIQDSTLNQANLIQEINQQQEDLVTTLKTEITNQFRSTIADAMMMMQQGQQIDSVLPMAATASIDSANSVISAITLDTLMSTIKDLKAEVKSLHSNKSTQLQNTNNDEINPRTGKPWK